MGSHPRTRDLFDFNRTDADVWVFNEAANTAFKGKHVDGVFQLHTPVIWKNPNNRNDTKHYDWLKQTTIPVFMQEQYEEIPAAVKLPRDEIMQMIARGTTESGAIREVSCSPSWAVAYAVYAEYKRIEIYGVELESGTEYNYQQGNFKFWLGVAIGKGIEVFIASTMFDNPQYGYEGEVEIPYTVFGARLVEIEQPTAEAAQQYRAAVETTSKVLDAFMFGDNGNAILKAVTAQMNAASKLGELEGIKQVNQYYKNKADDMIKTTERFVFSRQEFEHNSAQAQQTAAKVQANFNGIGGQLSLYHDAVVMAAKNSPKRRKQIERYKAHLAEYLKAAHELSGWQSAAQENQRYMIRLDAGVKAAGGIKSEQAILGNQHE